MKVMLLREGCMKGVYQVMRSRKGKLMRKISNSRIPLGEKTLAKDSWTLGNYGRVCAGKGLR